MNSEAFVCHPSVRIRGTENNYNPAPCLDMECMHRLGHHMHCPFCNKAEAFQDPVILKAHYRVKHVDKGVDFAGLKILRCCDSCEIVGVIKGEKRFKGAHWHCYRCKNGFNRRDEAIKHYNTHFRNPRTTFQIQIAQEVNQPNPMTSRLTTLSEEEINTSQTVQQAVLSITNAESVLDTSVTSTYSSTASSIAANETVRSSDTLSLRSVDALSGGETIMIIDGGKFHQHDHVTLLPDGLETGEYCTYEDVYKDRADLKRSLSLLQVRNHRLEAENRAYKRQVEQLKLQVSLQEEALVRQRKRETELVDELSATSLPDKLQPLLDNLRHDHDQLLASHLLTVRDAVIQHVTDTNVTDTNTSSHVTENTSHVTDNTSSHVTDNTSSHVTSSHGHGTDSNFSSQTSKTDFSSQNLSQSSKLEYSSQGSKIDYSDDSLSDGKRAVVQQVVVDEAEQTNLSPSNQEVEVILQENLEIAEDEPNKPLYVHDESSVESPAKKFCPS